MNAFSRTLTAALLVSALAGRVEAQTASTTPGTTLTLDQVVEQGLRNSKQVRAAAARFAAAQARTRQTRDATVPAVTLNSGYSRLSDNIDPFSIRLPDGTDRVLSPIILNQYTNRLSVSEPVFTGLRARHTIQATEFLENAARFDTERERKDVHLNLLNAALNLYRLEATRRTFDRSLVTAQTRLEDTKNLREQGLALDNDVLKADLALSQLETARLEADNAIRAAQFALAVLLGLPENTAVHVDSASVAAVAPGAETLDAFLGNAANRADVQAAGQRTLAAEKQVQITRGAMWPLVSVGANLYNNRPNQRQFPLEDRFIATWDAGVTLSWNLGSLYTARHGVQEAKFNAQQTALQREQLSDAARTDITNNYYAWQTAVQRIALAEKSVAQAVENQRIVQLRAGQQVASTTDLLEADALLLQAQIQQATARADADAAYFRLLKSAGRL